MHRWRVAFDAKLGVKQHRISPGFGHSLVAPTVSHLFQVLRIPAAVWEHGMEWLAIHSEPNPLALFEIAHGHANERYAYNGRQLARALRDKATVRGEHAGYSDFFVPIVSRGEVIGVLVTGPFALARATGAEILERWHWLTGRQGHPAEAEFASYLTTTFSALVLEGKSLSAFEQLLGCLACLLAGEGDAGALVNRAEVLCAELGRARFVDQTWDVVRELVDERLTRAALSLANDTVLRYLGLPRTADSVAVGLMVSRTEGDAVDEAVRRDAFQRRAVELARKLGDTISGQVGDHGVVFLCGPSGGIQRKRRKLLDVAERVAAAARREFGFSVHFGASIAPAPAPLSHAYQAALAGAEFALSQGDRWVMVEPGAPRAAHSLRRLRNELSRKVVEEPDLLAARFDRYVETVGAQCAYRLDAVRGHLEAGFERVVEPLIGGVLEAKSFETLCDALDRAAAEARTVSDLFAAYRRAVNGVVEAIKRPVSAHRDRSLQRAADYVRQHYTEPLRLEQVAQVAGITPDYFSKLFKQRERMTFEQYVSELRVGRAKQLLSDTGLSVARVAEMSGFNSPEYLSRVFRRATGATPRQYRKNPVKKPNVRMRKSA